MNEFNYIDEIKKLSSDKKLVEIYFTGAPSFNVALILDVNSDYITFCLLNINNAFGGVSIYRRSDIESISTDTAYLKELSKQISLDSIYEQGLEELKGIEDFSFQGFLSYLKDSDIFGEVSVAEGDAETVKVVGMDKDNFAIDEYSENSKEKVARTYYNLDDLVFISLSTPRVDFLRRFLAE